MRVRVVRLTAALALAGCGSVSGGTSSAATTAAASAKAAAPSGSPVPYGRPSTQPPQSASASGFVVLHDPGQVTGTLTGPCHSSDSGQLPDPRCTPGGIDPAVTQPTIGSTICTSGYTSTIRPPEAQTEALADASGVATIGYYIGGATPGFTVVVDATAAAGSRSANCSTSFTPAA